MAEDVREGSAPVRLLSARRLIAGGALLLVCGTLPSAQAPPSTTQATPVDAAAQALNAGRFDEVDAILRTSIDSRAIVLRAKATLARGRYADAEKLLSGPAASGPGSDAALELGQLQMYLGRRQEGRRTLQRVLASVNPRVASDFVRLALAARGVGEYQRANGFFRDANRLAANDPDVNAAWGELFNEKYNQGEALKSFQVALKQNENHLAAQTGLARVASQGNPPAAKAALERILKINPNHVPAHLIAAEMALDDRRRADARASIKKALEVNPNSLEARSLEAAIAFLEGRTADFEAQVREVLRINPVYGEIYRVTGDHLGRNYRFDEAVLQVRRALEIDDENARAYADLGMHLLRTGDEPGARRALERAFKDDPFHDVTLNSLKLLDSLDKFETIQDGDIIIKFHPDEVAVMREYALPLAKQALATLSKQYEFRPTGPILIEMFPKHDDFAVRTLGLPGFLGALGACFGRVVTLDSPKARPPGEFNWGQTLWHEIAHVITLQMSNNRMPRWLSEGMSQWEERRARPEWGHEMELSFAQALEDGKVLKLDVISEGFSDPKLISLTYHEASLVVEHLVDTYGEPAIRRLLRAYGRGLETEEAFKETYKVGLDEIQKSFDAKLARDYDGIRSALKKPEMKATPSLDELKKLAETNPGSFAVQMELGQALHEAGDKAAAIQALERASALLPMANGQNNPNALIALIAAEQKDTTRAIRALDDVLKVDHTSVESARKLAALLAPLGDAAKTEDAYRRIVAIDPFDSQAQTGLGRLALRRKETQAALRAFRSALATNPPDRASAHADLAEAYVQSGDMVEARRQTLAALEIAPSFERAQDLLLKIVEEKR